MARSEVVSKIDLVPAGKKYRHAVRVMKNAIVERMANRNRDFWTCGPSGLTALIIFMFPQMLYAQAEVYSNYEERIGSRFSPDAQGLDEVFGARINAATGGVSFSVPVLSIPGNHGLDISVSYKMGIRNVAGATEWYFEEDEPYLTGSFSESLGWVALKGETSRCSANWAGGKPPDVPSTNGRPGKFYADEYWSGYYFSTPTGGGSLRQGHSGVEVPKTGGPFYWATNGFWFFSCIPLAVGVGEGFLGYSPNGLKYYFDTMRDGLPIATLNKRNYIGSELDLDRREIRIYAGKIEDRFGNYITALSASDGRNVIKTESGNTVTYTYGTQKWVVNKAHPFTVTYPDGSVWRATVSGSLHDPVSYKGTCPTAARSVSPTAATTATIQAPIGATAVYTLKQVILGYSYAHGSCATLDGGGSATVRASIMASSALVKRVVTGPGLVTQTLDIDYGPANDCYASPYNDCSPSSPTWRTIIYSYSDGRYIRHIFGNRDYQNADLLLRLEEGMGQGLPQRTTEYEYSLLQGIGNSVGFFPHSVSEHSRPVLVSKKIRQDGRLFESRVPSDCGSDGVSLCIDQQGRAIKRIEVSSAFP